jgi:phosphodiesterase/alkaline phosphatase D-like protein
LRRIAKLSAAVLAVSAVVSAVALAASSPTVTTGSSSNATNTTVVLQATVNPNGSPTGYQFEYGPTSAYGLSTTSHSAGGGSKPVSVQTTVTGLTPGTFYDYRVVASNKSGTGIGANRTFKTTGAPPAGVVTGPAAAVGKSIATLTGDIDPEGAVTTWVFQYGLSTSYAAQTNPPQTLAASTTPVAVSLPLAGLEPGTLFHFRLVAFHGATVVSTGADQTFLTEPGIRPHPRLRASTTPAQATKRPYQFTTTAQLSGPSSIPASLGCVGNATIRYFDGTRQVAAASAVVQPNCTFSAQVSFGHLIRHRAATLKVEVQFLGNGYFAAVQRTEHVTLG